MRLLGLLHEVHGTRLYEWGPMMWDDIKGELQHYQKEKVLSLYTRCRYVEEVSPYMSINSTQNGVVWDKLVQ